MHCLSVMCYKGVGVPACKKEAYRLARLAAERGEPNSQFNMGIVYETGEDEERNDEEVVNCSHFNLNYKAAKWYNMAANSGHPDAVCNLAIMYREGRGVPKNSKYALQLFKLSADAGDPVAQCNLASIYSHGGDGILENKPLAAQLYHMSAMQGNSRAQYNLGVMYKYGKGVEQNAAEAAKWYRLAAEQDYTSAQYVLQYKIISLRLDTILPLCLTQEMALKKTLKRLCTYTNKQQKKDMQMQCLIWP